MKNTKKSKGDARSMSSSIAASRSKNSLTTNQLKPAYYLLGTLVAAASISGALLVSSRVSADDNTVVDDVSITIPVSCSMAGNVTTAHSANLMNGIYSGGKEEYANGIGSTTLSVSCNDAGGFSIYTVGFTGNKEGDNTLKGTNTGLTIPTGVYSTGDTTSKWSMKITKGADSGDTTNHPLTIDNGFDSFHTVPSKSDGYQRIAHKDAATDMNATPGASVTTTYDAYISTTQAADTYTGQVKYVMVHPYSSTDDNKPVIPIGFMQDVAEWKNELTTGEEAIAIDSRDNKAYTVAKMADGNIWMNQNLDLCIGCSGTAALTSENTDLNTSGNAPYVDDYANSEGVITWTPDSTAVTSGRTISGTTVSGWTSDYNEPYSAEGGDVYVYTSGSDSDDTTYNSLADCKANHTEAECKHYHRGNYYNWTAAIASNASSSISSDGSTAANSVCPKGWRLPKGNENGSTYEFGTVLLNAGVIGSIPSAGGSVTYASGGLNKIRSTPLYLVRSGLIYSSTLFYSASIGYYWSSTVNSSDNAYYLTFNSSHVYPRYGSSRGFGSSVRCLAPAS